MKKNVKGLLVVVIIIGLIGVSIPIIFILMPPNTPLSQKPYVRVYVNSSIYDSLSSEITQYEHDIGNQGYKIDIVNWTNNNVSILKQDILNYYNTQALKGVVLIGDMPYALARNKDIYNMYYYFPCDLYLMDLDGNWTDYNGDEIWDVDPGFTNEHNSSGTADIFPEIWLGRICPESLNNLNHLQAYRDYFDRNHKYRNGTLSRPHSALLYIDDTWSGDAAEYLSNFTAYSNVTLVATDPTTNRTDYLNRLTQNYELVHFMAHSWPWEHQLDVPASPTELVLPVDILNTNTKALFFNLYCCYACNFTTINNLGTQYLFSNNSLTIIGCSRSGGMCLFQPFYDELKNGGIIGEGFRIWFENPEIIQYNHLPEIYGMTILGDPLLYI